VATSNTYLSEKTATSSEPPPDTFGFHRVWAAEQVGSKTTSAARREPWLWATLETALRGATARFSRWPEPRRATATDPPRDARRL